MVILILSIDENGTPDFMLEKWENYKNSLKKCIKWNKIFW